MKKGLDADFFVGVVDFNQGARELTGGKVASLGRVFGNFLI